MDARTDAKTPWTRVLAGSFPAFVLLQGSLYAAYGTESPFLPSFLAERGLTPGEIGVALAAGTLMRLAAGPVAGHLADHYDATRAVLGIAAAASGLISFAYLAGYGFWPLLAVSVLHASAIAALAPLADTLALATAKREGTFAYGWVRGAGSAAFVVGTLISGLLVARAGLSSIIMSSGLLFLVMAAATARVPAAPPPGGLPSLGLVHQSRRRRLPCLEKLMQKQGARAEAHERSECVTALVHRSRRRRQPCLERLMQKQRARAEAHERSECVTALGGIRELLALGPFRRILVVGALVIGSHALNDGFAVIRWRGAGLGPSAISLLWSEAVASEVFVFVVAGPWLLGRLGIARSALLAAGVGALRWSVMATTTSAPVLAAIQPMHGLTFALLHLAAMRLIVGVVPERLWATAQTFYGTFGLGVASAVLTATGGLLYGAFGAGAFWVMAALCAAAMAFAPGLRAADAPA